MRVYIGFEGFGAFNVWVAKGSGMDGCCSRSGGAAQSSQHKPISPCFGASRSRSGIHGIESHLRQAITELGFKVSAVQGFRGLGCRVWGLGSLWGLGFR